MCAGACAGAEAGPQNQNVTGLVLPSMGGVLQSSETWAVPQQQQQQQQTQKLAMHQSETRKCLATLPIGGGVLVFWKEGIHLKFVSMDKKVRDDGAHLQYWELGTPYRRTMSSR